jgi:putative NADH-flavin reductase
VLQKRMMDRKIIVFGATGNTGIEICKVLETNNITHTAFVRKGSEQKLKTKQTAIVSGDVLKAEDVVNAFSSVDYSDVIISLGSRDFRSGEIRSTGTKHIVEALKEKGSNAKVHVISANGTGNSWDSLKWNEKLMCKLLISKAMKDHTLQEEHAKSNPGGYHIIRPVALKNEAGTGQIASHPTGTLPNNAIARADVAKYLVDSMLSDLSGEHSISKA